MEPVEFKRLQRLSVALTGNNTVLPVAAAVSQLVAAGTETVSAPEIVTELGGVLASNRVGGALTQLSELGALRELPYPGRPHRRMYEYAPGPIWDLVRDWALDPVVDVRVG